MLHFFQESLLRCAISKLLAKKFKAERRSSNSRGRTTMDKKEITKDGSLESQIFAGFHLFSGEFFFIK